MKKNMIAVILSIVIAIGSVGAIPVFAVETTAQEAVAIGSGTCGESAVWTLTGTEGDLTLTISGSGDMENFSWMGTPWKSYRGINACVIEDGITSIGDCAFRYTEISSISLPDSITSIGDYAFYGCYYLSNITIPNNVTSIGKYAFYDCESLKSVSISGNVRSIGDYAFALCATTAISGTDHLLEVNYAGSEDEWNSISIGPNNSGLLNANIIFSSHNHIWNEEYSIDKEATCTEEGSESIHCSTCGKINESTVRIIPKKDHSYGDWIVTKEPLCTEEGSREKHCIYNCGNKITEVIPATGHIWNEEYTVDVEASDTEEGSESIHCSVCDIIREGSTRVIEKTEHAYGEWEIVNAATCTETGLQKKICTVCGDEITEEIPATGHIWNTEYTVDKEPTATEEGLESIHCSVCDSVKEGSETVIPQILKPMTMLMISEPEEKTYTGSEITQEIVVIDGDKILVEGIDYTVEYTGNIYPGTATITIEGKGDYVGTITKQFKINQLATPALSSVTAVDSGTGITLAWNAVAGANKYRIYRKAGTSSWRALAMTTSTSYTDKNVSAGTKYTYTIRCIADDEKTYVSGYNATGMAITYAATPTLGKLSNQASGIKITWNKATGAVKYRVFKKTGTGDWKTLVDTTSLSYVDKYVSTGTNYTYTVRCITSDGTTYTSGFNSTGKYTVFSARPTISSVSSPNAGQLTVQWSNVSNITGCQIQCSQSSTFAKGNKTVTVESATQVTKTISSLTSKKKYYVRMRTYKTVGGKDYYSTWSKVRSVTVK